MKKIFCLLLALALSLGLFAACGTDETGTFSYYIAEIPATLDPQVAASAVELTCVQNLYRGLYRLSADGKPVPDVAERCDISDGGLVYTFTLKEGLRWSRRWNEDKAAYTAATEENPGLPLTADDFVFALQRVFTPATGSPYAGLLNNIEGAKAMLNGADASALGVNAQGDRTLVIRLAQPDEDFLKKLCSAGAMPCNRGFFEYTSGSYGLRGKNSVSENVLNNGFFNLTVWDAENGVTLRRPSPEKGQLGRVRLIPENPVIDRPVDSTAQAPEAATPLSRLSAGLSNAEILPLGSIDGAYDQFTFTSTVWGVAFNCNDAYFSNASIRRGLSMAALQKEFSSLSPAFEKAGGIVPPSVTLAGAGYREQAGSLLPGEQDARGLYISGIEELIGAGVIHEKTEGKKLSGVVLLIPEEEPYHEMAVQLSQVWQKELSAFFSLKEMPLSELEAAVKKGDYQLALYPLRAARNDVPALLSAFSAAGTNLFHYQGVSVPSSGASLEACRNAERQLLEDFPFCPLVFETTCFALSGCKDVIIDPFGPILDFTWASMA
ncbi:MAG: peptide ABC transporter substrate-binding protein [Oscillospiraceae bacterium]|nr:peptide ABC transporter substrate-binding protein [Oscillospiraceae bacterium]